MTALGTSVWLLAGVTAAGAALGGRMMMDEHWPVWARRLGIVHGVLAVAATCLAFWSLGGPVRGIREGAGAFGKIAVAMLIPALAVGIALYAVHRRRRAASPVLVAVHAMLGVSGAVMLAAWWSMPPA